MEQKMNIVNVLLCMLKGTISPQYFNRVAGQPKALIIIFAILMSFVTTFLYWGVTYAFVDMTGGLTDRLNSAIDYMPKFTYENCEMTVDGKSSRKLTNNTSFVVNTAIKSQNSDTVTGLKAGEAWSIGRSIISFNAQSVSYISAIGTKTTIMYKDIIELLGMPESGDRESLKTWIRDNIEAGILTVFLISLPVFALIAVGVSFGYAGLGTIPVRLLHGSYSYSDLFLISLVINALTTLVFRIITALPFSINRVLLCVIIMVITLVYLVLALMASSVDTSNAGTIKLAGAKKRSDLYDDNISSIATSQYSAAPTPLKSNYTFEKKTETPVEQPTPAPAPAYQKPEPVAEQIIPTPAPAPAYQKPEPVAEQIIPTPAPAPVYQEPKTPVEERKSIPIPAYYQPTPPVKQHTPAPTPVYQKPEPVAEQIIPTPAPVPAYQEPEKPVARPTITKPLPNSVNRNEYVQEEPITAQNNNVHTENSLYSDNQAVGSLLLNRNTSAMSANQSATVGSALLFRNNSQNAQSTPQTGSSLYGTNSQNNTAPGSNATDATGFNAFEPTESNRARTVDKNAALGNYGGYSTGEQLSANSPMNIFLQKRQQSEAEPKFEDEYTDESSRRAATEEPMPEMYADNKIYGQTYHASKNKSYQFGAQQRGASSMGMGMANDDDFEAWEREHYPDE